MKRICSLLLILILIFSLVACGDNSFKPDTDTDKHITQTKTPQTDTNTVTFDTETNIDTQTESEKTDTDDSTQTEETSSSDTDDSTIDTPIENTDNESVATSSDKEQTKNPSGKIVMPNNASDYIGSAWTIETITEHFKDLGFTNIEAVSCKPDDDNYKINIYEIEIATGWFSEDPWSVGEEFDPDDKIYIYYNEFPLLTTDNCSDLAAVLSGKNMDYKTFCDKYDGRYVEFDAYVTNHTTYDGGTSHIISVAGGNYTSAGVTGLIIRIGDRTWNPSIDKSVEKGNNVTVSGRIDASKSEYYGCLYVETRVLSKR